MRKILILLLPLIVTSCTTKHSELKYRGNDRFSTHGLVLFKTVIYPPTAFIQKQGGLSVKFKNINTAQLIENNLGYSGYPDEMYYAIWFPPGVYELEKVFFYNGSMKSKNDAFRVKVNANEIIYIGTISQSWSFPSKHYTPNDIISAKQYQRNGARTTGMVFIMNDNIEQEKYFTESGQIPPKPIIRRLLQ